ncbi:class I SAM-dependent methyltransferase [Robiginitomaculum antarcticum]|uniref:class I SAM-dependent methyltransferase n=1 Tax=Robiginitomaculum antarcticum TaxID=437507 RepID=UPI00037146B0|nr:class I SAM-dependent methyltransferase [Robiginitomaculum antarcticum]
MSTEWDNYWQGRSGVRAGAALDGVGVETHTGIAGFWDDIFTPLTPTSKLVDLACGAGTVLRRAQAAGISDLTGADISSGAITALQTNMQDVQGVVCALPKTPFTNGQFDIAVSQFGFEYAGAYDAATEIARIIAPGGQFAALAHYKGGAIDKECAAKSAKAHVLIDSRYLDVAKDVFAAANAQDQVSYNAAITALSEPRKTLDELARSGMALAKHIQAGTAQMFGRLQNYALPDVIGWLDGNAAEVTAYLSRMEAMQNAALSADDVAKIGAALRKGGMAPLEPDVFAPDGDAKPIAWTIRASKP